MADAFSTFPEEVFDQFAHKLGSYGWSVYISIIRYTNSGATCFISQGKIVTALGISRAKVVESVRHLVELGLLETDPRPDGTVFTLKRLGG